MRHIAVLAISLFVVLSVGGSIEAQMPPTEVSGTIFEGPGLCDFDVRIDVSGKGSQIDLPRGGFILTSPGLTATITNVEEPEHQITLNVTGTITETVLENGNVQRVMHGRNLFFDPSVGFVLLIGNFTAVTDATNTLVQPLDENGQVIDICALLKQLLGNLSRKSFVPLREELHDV
jgi:hypothetical protein